MTNTIVIIGTVVLVVITLPLSIALAVWSFKIGVAVLGAIGLVLVAFFMLWIPIAFIWVLLIDPMVGWWYRYQRHREHPADIAWDKRKD